MFKPATSHLLVSSVLPRGNIPGLLTKSTLTLVTMASTITTTTTGATRLFSQAIRNSSPSPSLHDSSTLPAPRPAPAATSTAPSVTATVVPLTDLPTLQKCLTTLSSAFSVVPCTNAFAAESNQTVHAYVTKTILESVQSHGGELVQAGDTSAVALWELPGPTSTIGPAITSSGNNTTSSETPLSIKQEWKNIVHAGKIKYIGVTNSSSSPDSKEGIVEIIKPHYHLDFLARNPDISPKVPGAISAVVRPYLARAKQEGLSVWLEATSLDVVPLYEYFGFRVMEEILVGKGKVDRSGRLQTGGEGVKAWLMVVDNSRGTK